jgi:uncharacterized protein YhhL (DUF1145 family)
VAAMLIALVQALGPWPSALLLLSAFVVLCGAIVLIVLRSKIALEIGRGSRQKWRVRFFRIEQCGKIGDLPTFIARGTTRAKHVPAKKELHRTD